MRVHLVNPSDLAFGTAVITPRWLFVLAAATPRAYGDPVIVDETLEHLDPDTIAAGDVVGIGIHTGNALRGYKLLNEALATEIVCTLRYKRHYFMASGIHAQAVAQEFLEHANEEQGHADQIAQRIVQLGGAPDYSPEGLVTRSHAEYVEGETLLDMIKEDLVAERIAIDSYREMAHYLGENDSTSRRLMEEILAVEEEHADDLVTLLQELGPDHGSR